MLQKINILTSQRWQTAFMKPFVSGVNAFLNVFKIGRVASVAGQRSQRAEINSVWVMLLVTHTFASTSAVNVVTQGHSYCKLYQVRAEQMSMKHLNHNHTLTCHEINKKPAISRTGATFTHHCGDAQRFYAARETIWPKQRSISLLWRLYANICSPRQ